MAIERTPYPEYLRMSEEWSQFFYSEETESILLPILAELLGKSFFPRPNELFHAFYECPLEEVQVVILGESPCRNEGATGLAFEVRDNHLLSSALQHIYRELEDEGFHPTKDGNLTGWARQGVLLLNCALTIPAPSSSDDTHLHVWKPFLWQLIQRLTSQKRVIWLLLGEQACEYREELETLNESHSVFCCSHPSRLTADKSTETIPAFLRSGVFRRINEQLRKWKKKEIVW